MNATPVCAECEGRRHTYFWQVPLRGRIRWHRQVRVRFCPYCSPAEYWKDYALRAG